MIRRLIGEQATGRLLRRRLIARDGLRRWVIAGRPGLIGALASSGPIGRVLVAATASTGVTPALVLRAQLVRRVDSERRREWLELASRRRPDRPETAALLQVELSDADPEAAAAAAARAWVLLPEDPRQLWLLPPLRTRVHESRPADDDLSAAIERLLDERDPRVVARLIDTALWRGDVEALADHLGRRGLDRVDAGRMIKLVEALHARGEIRRPLELLRHARADHPELERIRRQRERELRLLDRGVPVVDVTVGCSELSRSQRTSDGIDALYLLHNSLPHQSGGYATRTHGLLTNLAAAGHRVVGVTRPGFPSVRGVFDQRIDIAPFDVVDGIRYERLVGAVPALPRSDLEGFVTRYAELLAPIVDRHRPRLVHAASNWWNGHAANAVAKAIGVPSIYEVRGLWEVTRWSREPWWGDSEVYRLDARYESDAATAADRVITITEGLRDELVGRGVERSKIVVVPNAVDAERFARVTRDDALAHELGLTGRCVIGFVGTMTFYEGLDDLLDAVALVRRRTTTAIGLLMVGDGPVRPELEERARTLGIDDLCRFVGRVPHDEVERYLGVIDITPFPRKPLPVCEMVSPLKPLESMASGIPVVVSSVRALSEMVPDAAHGLIVPASDVEALTEALVSLVDDPDLRTSIADTARRWVSTERSWEVIARRVGSLYEELQR